MPTIHGKDKCNAPDLNYYMRTCTLLPYHTGNHANYLGEWPSIMSRRALLEAQAERILNELNALPNVPPEPSDDQVLHIRVKFATGRTYYHYAAIKIPAMGVWFITGTTMARRWPEGVSWEGLMEWLSAHDYEVWAATDYERVSEIE